MRRPNKPMLAGAALLAAAAALAIAALAGLASASSSVWLENGKPLNEHRELSLSGGEVIEFGPNALLCNSTATMATNGGSTAEIAAYNVEKASCIGLEGEVKGCTVTAASAEGLPWSISLNTVDMTAHEVTVAYSLDQACPVGKLEVSFPEVLVTPEAPSAIRLFHFHKEGTGSVDGKSVELTDTGVQELPEAEFGRYGIG